MRPNPRTKHRADADWERSKSANPQMRPNPKTETTQKTYRIFIHINAKIGPNILGVWAIWD